MRQGERETAGGEMPRIAQAAVLAIRRDDDGKKLCLVTSLKRKRWILPKGIVDPGETPQETALKEAFEEAGLEGRIVGEAIGSYQGVKWGAVIDVTVFPMETDHCLEHWGESHLRKRTFVTLGEAVEMVQNKRIVRVLKGARDWWAGYV